MEFRCVKGISYEGNSFYVNVLWTQNILQQTFLLNRPYSYPTGIRLVYSPPPSPMRNWTTGLFTRNYTYRDSVFCVTDLWTKNLSTFDN